LFAAFQGGGIVFDSIEEDEYVETLNKLKANLNCIEKAERASLPFPAFSLP
jgi:anthranilate/para-aminobenzoate synthase component I